MSADREMEIIVQQKLADLRMEPEDRDWEVIHERLHGRKRRRFLLWLLPLFLSAGASWFMWKPATNTDIIAQQNTTVLKSSVKGSVPSPAPQRTIQPPVSTTTPAEAPESKPAMILPDATQAPDDMSPEKVQVATGTGSTASTAVTSGAQRSDQRKTSKKTEEVKLSGTPKEITPYRIVEDGADDPSKALQAEMPAKRNDETTEAVADRSWSMASITSSPTRSPWQVSSVASLNQSLPLLAPAQHKAIPAASQKRWTIGVYAEAGINMPRTGTGPRLAAADAIPNIPSPVTGAGTQAYTLASYSNGTHWSAGLSLQRPLGKWKFMTGLGLQWNSWRSQVTNFVQRSTTGGAFQDSTLETYSGRYRQMGIEIPVMFGINLLDAKRSSLYLQAGINNLLTLQLNSSPGGNIPPARYRPQLRTGLVYGFSNKWQIGPYFQYGLGHVVTKGEPGISNSQAGLQILYTLKK